MALKKSIGGSDVDLNATDKRGKTLLQYGDCLHPLLGHSCIF